jgi:GNAT superfamily N-acetyltransferase
MGWVLNELRAEETHNLRRKVSADGRTDMPTMEHELDHAPGSMHLGATDENGQVVAISSYFASPSPFRSEVQPAIQLALMAVDPSHQRLGIGTAILTDAIRRLRASGFVLLWANARDSALPFYQRFGFTAVARVSGGVRPHNIIELDL